MNQTETNLSQTTKEPSWGWVMVVSIAILCLLIIVLPRAVNPRGNAIKPIVPTQTAGPLQVEYAPITLDFAELGSNPTEYQNQRIRVSGQFAKIALPNCRTYSGPIIRWGLVNDTQQMNAIGYEAIVKSLPENTEMTVEGIWTFYPGSVGCGKESQEKTGIWYLQVEHVLQPNPIVAAGAMASNPVTTAANVSNNNNNVGATPLSEATTIGDDDTSNALTATPTATSTPNGTPTNTATAVFGLTNTPTSESLPITPGDETSTPTVTATVESPTVPNGTSTPTPTATQTAVSTVSPPRTATPGAGPPPASTATPGSGYPGATPPGSGYP